MAEYVELNELQKFCGEYTEVDAIGLILADRSDLLHTVHAIPIDKVKQAREEIKHYEHGNGNMFTCGLNRAVEILDKLIESEE